MFSLILLLNTSCISKDSAMSDLTEDECSSMKKKRQKGVQTNRTLYYGDNQMRKSTATISTKIDTSLQLNEKNGMEQGKQYHLT